MTHKASSRDETDGKKHSESPNKQEVIESNENNRPMNLSRKEREYNFS